MITITIKDFAHCCFGLLEDTDSGYQCFILGLPWRDNIPNLSRIPKGVYSANKHKSHRNGDVIAINDVVGRTHIQIHSGNFTYQIAGCFLVGDSIKFLDDDKTPDITNSRNTLKKLLSMLPDKFEVRIQ